LTGKDALFLFCVFLTHFPIIEFCNSFMHLKKATQLIVAATLRRSIWGWIETYPGEFMQLCQSQKKLDGGPDILFEICLSLADTTRKKAILWPLQTMLLVLCPDILYSLDSPDVARSVNSKKVKVSLYTC
jgi:neurofibromin 1